MHPPSGGKAEYRGRDIFTMGAQELVAFRGKVQMVFQDPFSSLNPKMSILEIISEPLTIRTRTRPHAWADRVAELLTMVGLRSEHADRFPHQFSGGQAQRIAIARALASEPELIICDEAVSALDALIQVQIVELLADLRERLKLSYIFITHDLALIRDFSDQLLVMKNGQVVEAGPTAAVFAKPSHPYTVSLFQALPRPVPDHA
jgi:peptide/nickel transport system ATP-binding protein